MDARPFILLYLEYFSGGYYKMTYVSLYRKWRPDNFADIAGQQTVVKTLKNAIQLDRIAHAYLFCGPRGTGKTSTAKILTKALNCHDGPTVTPCNQCEPCLNIKGNNPVDMIEIDAASNRGIDKIREIREKIRSAPLKGNYKVYIIDEVHMLTTEAFNALLKTLEEPPDYVIFILATTEPHKLLPTILSRCQRFDFTRLSIADIKDRLDYICKQEGIKADNEAISLIARNADGGMRDAISILDQSISYSGNKITASDLEAVLGLVSNQVLFKLTEIIFAGEIEKALDLVNQIVNQGKDIKRFISDLVYHFRNLLLVKECKENERLLDITTEQREVLIEQANEIEASQLLQLIEIANEIEADLKQTTQPRIILEMGVIKLIKFEENKSLIGILDRISRLEEQIDNKSKREVTSKKTDQPQVSNLTETSATNKQPNNDNKSNPEEEKKSTTTSLTLSEFKDNWEDILDYLKNKKRMRLQALLRDATPSKLENNKLTIAFEHEFHKDSVEQEKEVLTKVIKKIFGVDLQVNCIFSRNKPNGTKKNNKEKVLQHQLVQQAVEIFNGDVVQVESVD
ncbi:DNA polymerase III subunit gamma/tau [Natroniella sulfidigena]|uniref:DNA polymerase III subunit gamma/tau n=1 Tax=Natroniella sulfidigena TaxID=723921 RepID=UPI00200A6A5E|nr:DNA polymerase III subunit gamma/tau [Natroniella sulfidigena]MCK8817102.1 DNA polymerase III subunit gamma/tau [Natroniella sulfidigena]